MPNQLTKTIQNVLKTELLEKKHNAEYKKISGYFDNLMKMDPDKNQQIMFMLGKETDSAVQMLYELFVTSIEITFENSLLMLGSELNVHGDYLYRMIAGVETSNVKLRLSDRNNTKIVPKFSKREELLTVIQDEAVARKKEEASLRRIVYPDITDEAAQEERRKPEIEAMIKRRDKNLTEKYRNLNFGYLLNVSKKKSYRFFFESTKREQQRNLRESLASVENNELVREFLQTLDNTIAEFMYRLCQQFYKLHFNQLTWDPTLFVAALKMCTKTGHEKSGQNIASCAGLIVHIAKLDKIIRQDGTSFKSIWQEYIDEENDSYNDLIKMGIATFKEYKTSKTFLSRYHNALEAVEHAMQDKYGDDEEDDNLVTLEQKATTRIINFFKAKAAQKDSALCYDQFGKLMPCDAARNPTSNEGDAPEKKEKSTGKRSRQQRKKQ
uniref:MIF4G domain-containing protein n=1 Tax=Panagrellus redivivus TaxID=6233 RepID=A0A7E4VQ13_PANRE